MSTAATTTPPRKAAAPRRAPATSSVLFDAPGPRALARHRILAVVMGLLLLAALGWVVWTFWKADQLTADRWGWLLTGSAWVDYLLPGLRDTLVAASLAVVIAMALALVLAMARMSDLTPVRWLSTAFVEFFRAVPVLIMMLFTFYSLVELGWFPDRFNPLIGTVTGLVLYNASVLCEVIRNGVASLPKGQREAGLSIGLTGAQVRRTILIPQALTAMLPTLVSQLIVILKDSALGTIILYPELVSRGRQVGSAFSATLPAYITVAALFILVNYLLSKLAEYVESRQRRRGRSAGGVVHADTATLGAGIVDGSQVMEDATGTVRTNLETDTARAARQDRTPR